MNESPENHHEPNKLADKIGVAALNGSTVNIDTLIVGDGKKKTPEERFSNYHRDFSNNLGDREIDLNGSFVGREWDLEKLHELLQTQAKRSGHLPMVVISGIAGVGKSELVRQYGKLHLNEYAGGVGMFDAVLFGEDVRNFMQPRFCEGDLRYFQNLKAQLVEGWQEWQKFCGAERSALIVIDDVTDYRTQVAPYLPEISGDRCPFQFLLTSRSLLHGDLALYEIQELTARAAVKMLVKWAQPSQQCLLDDPAIATKLCERLGCLPLALTLVGSWLSNSERTLPMAIAALEDQGLSSSVLEPDRSDIRQKAEQGLKAAFVVSWQQLSVLHPSAQQLGRILGLFEPVDLPWELVEQMVQAYPKQSLSPPVRKSWWQRLGDSLRKLSALLFPFWVKPSIPPQAPFVPIRDLVEARIALRKTSLLQSVEQGKTYRLHRLAHEFFGEQWAESDRQGWLNAWMQGLSDRADQIPAFASWDLVTAWQPLRPHLESAQKITQNLLHSTTNPASIDVYKRQQRNLNAACFRLAQAPIFEATYRQAKNTHAKAKTALAKGETPEAQKYFGEVIAGYQKASAQARVALPENSTILAGYLNDIACLFHELGNYSAGSLKWTQSTEQL